MMITRNPNQLTSTARLKNLLGKEVVLLDVRTPEEYVGSHLQNALNIPYDDIDRRIPAIRKWHKPVLTYSTYGRRSRIAAAKLKNHGIEAYDIGRRDDLHKLLRG